MIWPFKKRETLYVVETPYSRMLFCTIEGVRSMLEINASMGHPFPVTYRKMTDEEIRDGGEGE